MKIKNPYSLFYYSLLIGIIIWLFTFLITPVQIVEQLKMKTIFYVSLCYFSLILGFRIASSVNIKTYEQKEFTKGHKRLFNVLVIILFLSFLLRWIDLFYIREVSFFLHPKQNRVLNEANFQRTNLLFILASILKSLYFFPIVFYVLNSFIGLNKKQLFIALLILCFPIVEAFVLGTRKPFFEISLIGCTLFIVGRGVKLSLKGTVIFIAAFIMTLIISAGILFKRESGSLKNSGQFYEKILSAKYNDLLKPNDDVVGFIKNEDKSDFKRIGALIILQTGQYLVHGLFEFNHIIDKNIHASYGEYTFYPISKFIKKINGSKDFYSKNPSPRKIVYLTAFGGFYLDFKWFSLLLFFLLGVIQKIVITKSMNSYIYQPLMIYFLIINVFLLVINYLRGAGTYTLVGFLLIAITFTIIEIKTNEKSTDS